MKKAILSFVVITSLIFSGLSFAGKSNDQTTTNKKPTYREPLEPVKPPGVE